MLIAAAFLIALLGLVHSILGERYILIRLFRRTDLPRLFGGTTFTRRTLRFAWHITTLLAWGMALLLIQLAKGASTAALARGIGWTLLACSLLPLLFTKGRHLAWLIFAAAGVLCLLGAN